MKRILSILLFTSIAQFAFAQQTGKSKLDTIVWKKSTPLLMEDFKGKPTGNLPADASTTITLYTKVENGSTMLHIDAVFVKSKSYIKDKTAATLKHEQLHFDIAELYARKLRQRIIQKDFSKVENIETEIRKTYDQVAEEWGKVNRQYDEAVQNGMNMIKQKEWNDKIANQLTEFAKYANMPIDIFE
jgi:hypothetical protein